MADLTKIINIKVNFSKGKIDIEGLTASINKLDQAEKNLSKTLVGSVQPAYKRTEQSIRDQITYQRQLQRSVEITSFEYVQYQRTIEGLGKELSTFQGKNAAVSGGMNGLRNSAGLASQTLVEVGRTISDSNYGFTAVANNLSQLGYYFVTLVDQSKGFTNAMKSLGKQLLGAGGLIIGFQLVIFLIERYSLASRKAKKATDDLNKSFAQAEVAITRLDQLNSTIQSVTASAKDQENALRALKKDGYDEAIGSIEDYIVAKKELLKYNVLEKVASKELEESFTKEIELRRALAKDVEDTNARIKAAQDQTVVAGMTTQTIDASEVRAGIKSGLDIREKEYEKQIKEVTDKRLQDARTLQTLFEETTNNLNNNAFLCLLFGDCKKGKAGETSRNNDDFFKQKLLNLRKLQLRYQKDSLTDERTTAEELIEINRKAAALDLQRIRDEFIEKEFLRFAEFKAEKEAVINNNKSTKREIEQAQKELGDGRTKFNASIIASQKEHDDTLLLLNDSFNNKSLQLERQKNLRFEELLNERDMLQLAATTAVNRSQIDAIDLEFEAEQAKTQRKIDLINQEKDIRLAAGEDTFIQDQQIANETEALNVKRLKSFQDGEKAKLAIANQVGEAIIAIAGEGSAVGKAVAVAMATMNTYEAVTAALGAKPYGPWNIAQAAATAAMGFVQVRNILKTEVPSPKGGAGGGAAAAPSIQPPDFNIVGQSASNQLASAVQGQFNQPVKAYVVSKDVSTAQEMDRNIVATASLG